MLSKIKQPILTLIWLLSGLISFPVLAQQLPPTMTLRVNSDGSGNGSISLSPAPKETECEQDSNQCTYIYDTATWVTLTAIPDEESVFFQWQPEQDCRLIEAESTASKGVSEVFMNEETSCTAIFRIKPIKLTFIYAGTGSGTVTLLPPGQDTDCNNDLCRLYNDITNITMTPAPDLGATFESWSGHEDCLDGQVTLDQDKSCIISFTQVPIHQLTTTTTGTGSGRINIQPAGPQYNEGTVVTLTAIPEVGSFFTGWSESCTGVDNRVTVTMTTDQACTANFAQFHNLTVNLNGNGTVTRDPSGTSCGANCATYQEGTQVTLTAVPNIDSSFNHWEGSCTGTGSQTQVVMDAVKGCSAHFELLPPPSLQFSMPDYIVSEVKNETIVIVTRAASSLGAISVNYQTQNGTAIAGTDYTATNGTLNWDNGDMTPREINIPLLENIFFGSNQAFAVTLANPSGGAVLGVNKTAQVKILEDLSETDPNLTLNTLQFIANRYAVTESEGKVNLAVERIGDNRRAVSVDYATVAETALETQDYTATQGILNWEIGEVQPKTITVPITIDAEPEVHETFSVALSNLTGLAELGSNATAQIKIIDSLGDPSTTLSHGLLQFTTSNYQTLEDSNNIILAVSRTQGSDGPVGVAYKTQDNSAEAGQDYTAAQDTLTWANGDAANKNIIIPVLTDTIPEGDETFSVYLSNPAGEANLGNLSQATVSILDSTGTPDTTANSPGILQFVADNYQVDENSGSLTITVTRTQGKQGVVEVTYATQNDTAQENDFIATQGTFRWLDGESDEKSFQVGLYDDGLIEGDEQFSLELFNPTGGARLGSNNNAVVTIIDNDATTVQFSSDQYVADEDDSIATITVSRTGGRIGQVSVAYEILSQCPATNCATLNEDYRQPVKGILTWVSGNTGEKTFIIRLQEDREVEGNEILLLRLSNLTGHAHFGTLTEATLTIVDNDSGECHPAPVIDCYLENHDNLLSNVIVTPFGSVVGGQLAGQINNEGVIQDVTLLANTYLVGGRTSGIVRGNISTLAGQRALIDNVKVVADTTLTNLIVGQGAVVDKGVILKEKVVFEGNSNIPYLADLKTVLGEITVPILDQSAIKLTGDILLYGGRGGIVGAINGLPELIELNVALRQNLENGYLVLDMAPLRYTALPIQVQQVWGKPTIENTPFNPLGLTLIPDGKVIFVTHTGRHITALPVVQNPVALRQALDRLGLPPMFMQFNGNLKVPLANGSYYMARPNLFSTEVPNDITRGLNGTTSPWIRHMTEMSLVFEMNEPLSGSTKPRQQFMYPAAADPEALYALSAASDSQTVLYNDGRVYTYKGKGEQKISYKGVLDYLIIPGLASANTVQLRDIADRNGDGYPDYEVIYPNGDRQVMYYCASCFEE